MTDRQLQTIEKLQTAIDLAEALQDIEASVKLLAAYVDAIDKQERLNNSHPDYYWQQYNRTTTQQRAEQPAIKEHHGFYETTGNSVTCGCSLVNRPGACEECYKQTQK
jgi:hypothetical protein